MAAVLGMCLLFKTVDSSYRSNNTYLKYSEWKEKALKNTQKLLWWKKKSSMYYTTKSCFEELHMFLLMWGIFLRKSEQTECKNFQAAEGLYGKRNYIFQ